MSKRAGLHSKANSKTKSNISPLAKVQGLTLFGSPQLLLHGENAAAYDELLGRVCATIKPVDIIDEMFIADVVSLELDVLRWRRLKSSLIQTHAFNALKEFLCKDLTELQKLARSIAEAQIDLRRVRHARYQLLSQALSDPDYESEAMHRKKAALAIRILRRFDSRTPMPDNVMEVLNSKPEGPYKFATILADKTRQLLALDRYERRALSRRKFAIRAFDTARR